jgi:Mycothiol maleylpyruvate isomerase N-terminal domain
MAKRSITADDARKLIEPGWNQLITLLGGIPEEAVESPDVVGDWSVKLIVGHIAYWERNAERVIRLEMAEEQIPPIDTDAVNAQVAAEDRAKSYKDLRKSLVADHDKLLTAIDEAGSVGRARLGGDTWDHYPEHIEQLEAWRAAKRT